MTHPDEQVPTDIAPVVDGTIPSAIDTGESPHMRRDPEIPRLVGMTEAAEILGVVRQRVWQLIDENKLPAVKVGNVGIVLREQVVLEYKALQDYEREKSTQPD